MAAPQLSGTQPAAAAGAPAAAVQPVAAAGAAGAAESDLEEEELEPGADAAPVVGRGGQPMSEQAISDRLARAQRNWERTTFGTSDPGKIAAIKAKQTQDAADLETLRARDADFTQREEAAKQAQMTDLEKVTADRDKWKAKAEALEGQVKDKDKALVAGQQDVVITQHATEHLDPEAVDLAKFKFQQHIKGLKPAELATFNVRKISKWFKDYAEKFPKFAKQAAPAGDGKGGEPAAGAGAAPPAPTAPPARQVPVSAPRRGALPPKPAGNPGNPGKTIKPGPQQMSRKELDAAYRKTTGRKLPY